MELARIPPIEHDFATVNDTVLKIKEQLHAWSSRFLTLEEKYYTLSTKVDNGISNLKIDMDVKQNNIDDKIKAVRLEMQAALE